MERFWKKHREKFWAPFELLMLFSALLAPVFFAETSAVRSVVMGKLSVSGTFLDFNLKNVSRSLASTVIVLKSPEAMNVQSTIVTDRQIRFEHSGDQEWRLTSIHRAELAQNNRSPSSQSLESVPLIYDKQKGLSLSTFIELFPGKNTFVMKYKSAKTGIIKDFPVIVDYSRIDTQD